MADPQMLDTVPDHLKTKYVPLMKDAFNMMGQDGSAVHQDFEQSINKIYADFTKDGGTEEQWNILAPAVHYGHFGP